MNSPQTFSYSLSIHADASQVFQAWSNPKGHLSNLLGYGEGGPAISGLKVTKTITDRRIDVVAWTGSELLFRARLQLRGAASGTDAELTVSSVGPVSLSDKLQPLIGQHPLVAMSEDLKALKRELELHGPRTVAA